MIPHFSPEHRRPPSHVRASPSPIHKNKANISKRRNFFLNVMRLCSKSNQTGITFRRGRFIVLDRKNDNCFQIYNKSRAIIENATNIVKNEYFREHFCYARGCLDRVGEAGTEVYEPMIEDQESLEHLVEYSKNFALKVNKEMSQLRPLGIPLLGDDFWSAWKDCVLRKRPPKKERPAGRTRIQKEI